MKLIKTNILAILSAIEKLTLTQKLLIQFMILAIIGGSSWYVFLSPAWSQFVTLRQEAVSLEQDIIMLSGQAAGISKVEKHLEERKRELILARALLSEDANAIERLLASFERLGDKKNLCFLLFQPGPEELHEYYASRSLQLRLRGNFHDLISYFGELTRLESLVSLESLRLSPELPQPGEEVTLSAEAVLKMYRSLSQAELEAGKK
jgi:type IV pilus assembly protein PilO